MFWKVLLIYSLITQIIPSDSYTKRKQLKPAHSEVNETWTGKWFPRKPDFWNDDIRRKQQNEEEINEINTNDVIEIISEFCDDGQTNLTLDWNEDPSDHICTSINKYEPNFEKAPILELYTVPKAYKPYPKCMNVSIVYSEDIPTFGNHRTLWPKYGEYQYIPRQRWLHTLEHGGIVMLYHPCAHPHQVNVLQRIVRKCLYRHIITPSRLLPPELPLAVVSWGKRLQMSFVDEELVVEFIKTNALKGLEHSTKIGQYSYGLLEEAKIVSDENDKIICPGL